jgi:hypothetical protein
MYVDTQRARVSEGGEKGGESATYIRVLATKPLDLGRGPAGPRCPGRVRDSSASDARAIRIMIEYIQVYSESMLQDL